MTYRFKYTTGGFGPIGPLGPRFGNLVKRSALDPCGKKMNRGGLDEKQPARKLMVDSKMAGIG